MNEVLTSLRRATNETGSERAVRRVMVSFKEKKDDDNSTKISDLLVGVLVLLSVAILVKLVQVGNKVYWRNTTKAKSTIETPKEVEEGAWAKSEVVLIAS